MALHKARSQFERARWRLRLLAPSWSLQLALSVAMMSLFSWRLGDTLKHYDDLKKSGGLPTMEMVWESTNVGLSFIAALCTLFEIGRFLAEALTPWTMLFTHIIKLTCASAILALDVVVYVKEHDRHWSLIGLGLDAVFIITATALALYATIIYRRLSSTDDYAHPANFKSYGFNDGFEAHSASAGLLGSSRISMDKSAVWQSSPRRSFSSSKEDVVVMQRVERTPSMYSHQRDTSFDNYVARRGSTHSNNSESDRQIALALAGATPTSIGKYSPLAGVDIKLDVPTVTVTDLTHSRSRSLSVGQNPLYRSDHVLVAVPEEEDDDAATGADRKKGAQREALLGGSHEADVELLPPHRINRSVSYDSSLTIEPQQKTSVTATITTTITGGAQARDSASYPTVPQEVDLADTKWAR